MSGLCLSAGIFQNQNRNQMIQKLCKRRRENPPFFVFCPVWGKKRPIYSHFVKNNIKKVVDILPKNLYNHYVHIGKLFLPRFPKERKL